MRKELSKERMASTSASVASPGASAVLAPDLSSRSLSAGGSGSGSGSARRSATKSVSPKNRSRSKTLNEKQSGFNADALKSRLNHLFDQIEKEFDLLISENAALKDRVDALEEVIITTSGTPPESSGKILSSKMPNNVKRDSMVSASQISRRIKTTYKMKTSRRIFNKQQTNVRGVLVEKYEWHKDGVWFVTTSCKNNKTYIGTASADGTACVADVNSPGSLNGPMLVYTGHEGCSVNCIRFHPQYDLIMTASGDSGAHIWSPRVENVRIPDDEKEAGGPEEAHLIKQPLLVLAGHSSVVISCDWMSTVDQCVTASWDRTADIYDINTGELVLQLVGHDEELTDVNVHSSAPLIVTSSHDTTFRLWDFRESIHSVSVFQGHTECVTSATFLDTDKVVSGSDDRTIKVWDLKNMRSPLTTIYVEAPINKVGVSQTNGLIAIPLENRNIRLYDSNGNRICRLPRNHHERMVTCVSFIPSPPGVLASNSAYNGIQLLTSGFDRKVCLWTLNSSDHKS